MSKKGYWMAMIDVRDPEVYKQYIEANAVAFAKYGAKFPVRAGRYENPEGPTGNRHVLVEFESYDKAVECYHSPEYTEARRYTIGTAERHMVAVEGLD